MPKPNFNLESTKIRYAMRDETTKLIHPFPIDPWELTIQTREVVCKEVNGSVHRKYTNFYAVGVYGGIATAYSVGCNFRCIFCWWIGVVTGQNSMENFTHLWRFTHTYVKLCYLKV